MSLPPRLFDRPGPEFGIWFQVWADTFLSQLEEVPAIQDALGDVEEATQAAQDAADLAIAAAASADEAADAAASETSIVNSFVKNFTGASPLEADDLGNVTVKNHDRQYGNTTLNPDVSITGDTLATGAVTGETVRVYYDDATRADTTPTFAFTVDPADAPVQGGDRHVIGAVEIPAAGTSDGGYVRPPGFTGPTP